MLLRCHATVTLMAAWLALGIAPAFAAKPEPTPLAPPNGPAVEIPIGSVSGTTTDCNLGVLGPAVSAYSYILPPDDAYYTLIHPATCGGCQSGLRLLTFAHMVLAFTAPCEIPVTISIVPAVDLGGGCLVPNPFAPPVCAPVEYVVSDGGVTGQCVDVALPVSVGCCIDGPVFLHIEFDQGTCPSGKPLFCGPAACSYCTQYNFYPGAGARGDDLCAILSNNLKGNIMYVESTCCSPTSTAPGSWGKLKTLYR